MKVQKIVTSMEELELTGATLLTIEDAEALPLRLREYKDWWWLRSPGYCYSDFVACVYYGGTICSSGNSVRHNVAAVRPALKIKNIESSNFEIGDTFIFDNKKFEVVSKHLAFCLEDIGRYHFREYWIGKNANDYEKSDVKKFVDKWFERSCKNGND